MRFYLLTISILLLYTTLIAAVPQTINYQGHLASSGGTPVNAAVDMTFTIYNAATNGTNLWTEDQTVQVNNGIYAVALGAINPIDPAIIDGDLWLGVKIGTDAEMTPRQKLHSVPFALNADTVNDSALKAMKLRLQEDYSYLVDNGDNTIFDPISGLTWHKNVTLNQTYAQAKNFCGTNSTGAHTDWALPNIYQVKQLFGVTFLPNDTTSPFVFGSMRQTMYFFTSHEKASHSYELAMTYSLYDGNNYVNLSLNNDAGGISLDSFTGTITLCVR